MSEAEVSPSDVYLQDELVFEKGQKYLIRAQSGHGKSSLLNLIYGSQQAFDGHINYDMSDKPKDIFSLRIQHISYVFQDLRLFPELSLWENIQLKNQLTHHKSDEAILAMIDAVQLSHKKDQTVKQLSFGQRQRIAIIRALCQPFDFLLMDEPFSHLDQTNIQLLTDMIDRELAQQDASLILTSLGDSYYFEYDHILNL